MTGTVLKLALAVALAGSACTVTGSGTITGSMVVYTEPPQDQVEKVIERPGYFWVTGRWDWQNGAWAWVGGHWERERAGFRWQAGQWQRRGNSWHWVDGRWAPGGPVAEPSGDGRATVVVGVDTSYPTAEPPPPKPESPGPAQAGFIWAAGRWEWKNGQWGWVDGHWERERANMVWTPGRWELRDGHWSWTEARWAPGGPVVRDHR